MNFQNALLTCKLVLASGAVPLLVGETGIGKTALARRLAEDMDAHLILVDANILKEGEIGGLPTAEDYTVELKGQLIKRRRTVYAIHTKLLEIDEVLDKNPDKKILMFIDELNRCEHAVQQELMNLILNREINGYRLVDNVYVLGAMNPSNKYDSYLHTDYQVVDMDPAQEDRFVWIEMDSDVRGWLEWGATRIHSDVLEFIATFPDYLHTPNAQETIKATPRSWERVARAYTVYKDNPELYPGQIFYNVIKGNVGAAIAQDFINFLESNRNPLIKPEEIFAGETLDEMVVERLATENHSRLFLTAANALRYLADNQENRGRNISLFVQLIQHFPSDLRMAVMQDIKHQYEKTLYPEFLADNLFVEGYFAVQQTLG